MTAGRRRGLCAPGPRLPGTALSVADSAVDAAAAAALRARIAAAFDTFRARVCRRSRVCTCAGIQSDRKAFASRHNGVSCACEAARLPPAMKPPCAPARAGGRVSSHRKSVRPAAEQAAAMITAVKVAVQARSEGFLVLHHVLGLAAARSEYNAGARQDGAPSPGVTPWIKFVAGACQPLPLCTERHLIERITQNSHNNILCPTRVHQP